MQNLGRHSQRRREMLNAQNAFIFHNINKIEGALCRCAQAWYNNTYHIIESGVRMESNKKILAGVLNNINDQTVNYRVQCHIDNHYFTIVTVYDIPAKYSEIIEQENYSCAIVKLDQGGYLSLFDIFMNSEVSSVLADDNSHNSNCTLELLCTFSIQGHTPFFKDAKFGEFLLEITDGHELIGLCPYNIKPDLKRLSQLDNICIPLSIPSVSTDTVLGKLTFEVFPTSDFMTDSLSFSFGHHIVFRPKSPLTPLDLQATFEKITSFFSLLGGEIITINRISVVNTLDDGHRELCEFIGYCNYPHYHMNALSRGNSFDATKYLRLLIFKVSDFADIGVALDSWFKLSVLPDLDLANKSYQRILLDEDVRIVTTNKFLAAMQMVEGFISALYSDETKQAEFMDMKRNIIAELSDDEEKRFIEQYLFLSGCTFRRALELFLMEGLRIFVSMSKSQFKKHYDEILDKIGMAENFV